MGNPLEDTGLLREGQAVNLFNMRDYSAAALVFEDVLEKVVGVERYHYYGGLVRLAKGYGAWDMADYEAALEHLNAARRELSVDFEDPALADRASALLNRLGENQPFLGRLWRRGKSGFSSEKVVDMVENARRRILDQGRYDDGVARLYRSVEMWHQWRLLDRYSIETETVKWERVDEGVQERFLDLVQTKELPEGLGLRHARILDHLLSGKDPEEDDAAFQKLLSARNSSILAHGVDPIAKRTAEKFLQYLDTLVTVPEELRSGARHAELLALSAPGRLAPRTRSPSDQHYQINKTHMPSPLFLNSMMKQSILDMVGHRAPWMIAQSPCKNPGRWTMLGSDKTADGLYPPTKMS
jgi:CRISPR-associated protein (TIGR02710 family)